MATVGLEHYLTVAGALFVIGIFGIFLNRKNVIVILMSIELMLLAVNINFVAFSSFLGDLVGQVFTMFVLTLRHRKDIKRQNVLAQMYRDPAKAMELVDVKPGQGL